MKNYLRRFVIIVLLFMILFSTTGCISFFKGIFESVLPSIDMARLAGNTHKYFTYNGKSVKAVYAGLRFNCVYIKDVVNQEKVNAEEYNRNNWVRRGSRTGVGNIKAYRAPEYGRWEKRVPDIDTSNMPDYFRHVVHEACIKLTYDNSYRLWLKQSERRHDGANGNTLVNYFRDEANRHPYYNKSDFRNAVVVYEISPLKDGNLYYWSDGKLYYYEWIYVYDFGAE